MYKFIRPLIFKFDPEKSHEVMTFFCNALSVLGLHNFLKPFFRFESSMLETEVFGIKFKNPVGIAAGFDKHAKLINFLPALGFGMLQVGDVSNLPWGGNKRPRLFRLPEDNALINRLGQNNAGADVISSIIKKQKITLPFALSIVKTPDLNILGEKAVEDFVKCFKKLYPLGSISVINVSCPNTEEGKTFEDPLALKSLLKEIKKVRDEINIFKPVLVKISPDVSFEQMDEILEICELNKIDGYILTNTSQSRENLKTSIEILEAIGRGGLSGQPIRNKSTELIRFAYKKLKKPCIIGLGGIDSPESAYEKIKAGASLVQIYTGLIYEGPGLVKKINMGLVKLLKRDGFKNISEAVGVENK